jgi:putative membrane protein
MAVEHREVGPTSELSLSRTHLASERTMLAWIRTAVSLITFGFSIQQFFRTREGLIEHERLIGPTEVGIAMMVIGLIALLLATFENRAALRDWSVQYPRAAGYPPPPRSRAQFLAGLVGVLGMLALFVMLFRR